MAVHAPPRAAHLPGDSPSPEALSYNDTVRNPYLNVDLHSHSTYSDGTLLPAALEPARARAGRTCGP